MNYMQPHATVTPHHPLSIDVQHILWLGINQASISTNGRKGVPKPFQLSSRPLASLPASCHLSRECVDSGNYKLSLTSLPSFFEELWKKPCQEYLAVHDTRLHTSKDGDLPIYLPTLIQASRGHGNNDDGSTGYEAGGEVMRLDDREASRDHGDNDGGVV
ncbi:hypothetical protein EDD18DRAFT_1416827 [Armillaria luteobubalina]|uniref:Uncharacterized protein n=1 Tax=Armillaria luteobubalina TaxID=153913 RepID=A0AA39PV26_9AGAR|nr:hypothetical protein EDD18DRAFT_1416827 [Armillaria luteobubalina]